MFRSIAQPLFYFRSCARALTMALPAACLLSIVSIPAAIAQQVRVSAQDGLISVQASNASAIALADELSNELGISVVVTGDIEASVNIDIIDEPLDKALAKLSPNYMLVHADKQPDSAITEIVLMMGEDGAAGSSAGGEDQFLPSGSPADDVIISDDQPIESYDDQQSVDGAPLRDPNRSDTARATADAAASDASGLPPEDFTEAPIPEAFDPVTGMPIDPVTGLPLE